MWSIPERYVGKRIGVSLKIPTPDGRIAGLEGTLEEVQPGAFILKTDDRKSILIPCDMVLHALLETSNLQVVSGNALPKFPKP